MSKPFDQALNVFFRSWIVGDNFQYFAHSDLVEFYSSLKDWLGAAELDAI